MNPASILALLVAAVGAYQVFRKRSSGPFGTTEKLPEFQARLRREQAIKYAPRIAKARVTREANAREARARRIAAYEAAQVAPEESKPSARGYAMVTSTASTCTEGCGRPVYKDGLCRLHHALETQTCMKCGAPTEAGSALCPAHIIERKGFGGVAVRKKRPTGRHAEDIRRYRAGYERGLADLRRIGYERARNIPRGADHPAWVAGYRDAIERDDD